MISLYSMRMDRLKLSFRDESCSVMNQKPFLPRIILRANNWSSQKVKIIQPMVLRIVIFIPIYEEVPRSSSVRSPWSVAKGYSCLHSSECISLTDSLSGHQGEEANLKLKAVESKMNSLHKKKTCILVPRQQAEKFLSFKWVFGQT